MKRKQLPLTLVFSLFFTIASVAQVLPSQTDLYNISLHKLENITQDNLKTSLKELQQTPDNQLNLENSVKKQFLEVVLGDQFLGLNELKKLASTHPTNYEVWNTLAWAYFIAEKYDDAEMATQQSIAIHPGQLLGSDHKFLKMIQSAKGAIPAKAIIDLKSTDFYDFLILQTTPKNSDTLLTQIHYLLYNKLLYLPQIDSITNQLIIDAGDLIAKKEDRNQGVEYYKYASKLDTSYQSQIKTRLELIEDGKRSVKSTFNWATVFWAIPLVALAFIGAATLKSYKKD